MKHADLLRQHLGKQHMMQLATVADGQPWICTVYYLVDDDFNLYWASLPSRRHSQEISRDPNVAAAIAVEFTKGRPVAGVQVSGQAEMLAPGPEILKLAEQYAEKFGRSNRWVEDFTAGKTEHRLYRLKPESIQIFDEVNFPKDPKQQLL